MTARPEVVVLDVNETLSDMAPLRRRFEELGAPAASLGTWFAGVLRDGFALTIHDAPAAFADVAAAGLRTTLSGHSLTMPLEAAVEAVMGAFSSLPVHPDVPAGLRLLAEAGVRVVTLGNGAASDAQGLLERAGVGDLVEATLSVQDAGWWKPHAHAYAWAADQLGVEAAGLALVAVHPWDVDGAARAGWTGAWLDRTGTPFPGVFTAPAVSGSDLSAVAAALLTR